MPRKPYPVPVNFTPDELATLTAEGADALAASFRSNMAQLLGRGKAIIAKADRENRDLTADEAHQVDRLTAQHDVAEQKLDALEDGDVATNAPSRGRAVRPEMPMASGGEVYRGEGLRIIGPPLCRNLFGRPQRDPYGGTFKNLGEFGRSVAGGTDARLMVTNAMGEGTGTGGGFMVPEQWAFGILDTALGKEAVRPRAQVLPMTTNLLNVPGFDYMDGTGGKRAGLLLTWGQESQALTEQVAKTRMVGLVAKKAAILVRVSNELMEDASAFDVGLTNAMTAAVTIGLDTAFINGTGAGQPLGILNAPATITVAKESSPAQGTGTLLLPNLAKMLGKISPASFANAVWFVHPSVLPSLYNLVIVIQNVAGTENVGGSFAGAVTQAGDGSLRIFGKEVVVTEACSVFSSAGDVILADFSQYAVGLHRDVMIERSQHVWFTTDELAFRLRLRIDGQPLASAPTKLRDGTQTVSPFVALGAR